MSKLDSSKRIFGNSYPEKPVAAESVSHRQTCSRIRDCVYNILSHSFSTQKLTADSYFPAFVDYAESLQYLT